MIQRRNTLVRDAVRVDSALESQATVGFVATSFETEDGQTGTMTGELTIRDLTHSVTLDVTLNRQDVTRDGRSKLGFSATGTLLRSEWGLGFAVPSVSDEVLLTIETELVEQVPAEDAED